MVAYAVSTSSLNDKLCQIETEYVKYCREIARGLLQLPFVIKMRCYEFASDSIRLINILENIYHNPVCHLACRI